MINVIARRDAQNARGDVLTPQSDSAKLCLAYALRPLATSADKGGA